MLKKLREDIKKEWRDDPLSLMMLVFLICVLATGLTVVSFILLHNLPWLTTPSLLVIAFVVWAINSGESDE